VEAHAEEERAHGMNLDGGRAGGVDLDDGHVVEAHLACTSMAGAQVALTLTVGAWWRRTRRRSEVSGVNLDGGHAGGVDLDGGTRWRHTWRRSKVPAWRRSTRRRADTEDEWAPVGGGEMIGLGFRGSDTLKKKNSSNRWG
jgi:hypothetical protein